MEVTKLLATFLLLQLSFALSFRTRIIGGEICAEDGHPWLAWIYGSNGLQCSGVLINQDWVLTAAHCYERSGMQLKLGVHNREVPREGEQLRTSAEAKCYPDAASSDSNSCAQNTFINDIMLVKLNAPVDYNDNVQPVPLSTAVPEEGTICKVMGWGSINASEDIYPLLPYCVDIEILNNGVCEAAYPWCTAYDKLLCAGVLEGGKDSCHGDSGGPLMCGDELQGILSFGGHPCAKPLEPGVYVKVDSYLDWIQSIIENNTPETS
ncbi:gilatoxin [Anolis carolinensis]|uniref:gilatoxin n=1 Tax=Anolis carolinensis TaxID=28377 RepID=UPI002F2B3C3B